MRHLIHPLVAGVVLLLATQPASAAQPTLTRETTVFSAVDAVEVSRDNQEITITGLREGATTPVELTFPVNASEACQKQALLAMDKPGRYVFEIRFAFSSFEACKIRRR